MSVVSEYRVTGMTCSHCESSVRDEVSKLDGVERIDVDAKTGRLVVASTAPIPDADIVAAVDEAGYDAARS